jgi:hypothetical protein
MNRQERIARRAAIKKIDEEAQIANHNYGMRERSASEDLFGIDPLIGMAMLTGILGAKSRRKSK